MRRFALICLAAGILCAPAAAGIPEDVTLEPAFGGATFNFPLALRHAGDGSGRRFIVERAGRIRIVDGSGSVLPGNFLDISTQTSTESERGLLGLAFHPEFAVNGRFYINHTANNMTEIADGDTVIAEYQVDGTNPDQADPSSARVVLVVPQDFQNHNGGDLHFGPDGYLYIGMGDGGSGNDPCDRGQTLDPNQIVTSVSCKDDPAVALLGKMLRIDVDGTTPDGANNLCGANPDGSAGYAVPPDNPFSAQANACGEVWSLGLRNPYRWSFDRLTGDLWIADVGQNRWEEVNFEPAGVAGGLNYGWKICEGFFLRGSTTEICTDPNLTLPVLDYPILNQSECAVTGGFRYRGPVWSLWGTYVYGDFCSGKIWFADEDGEGGFSELLFAEGFGGLVGFGEDQEGRLYALRSNGQVLIFDGDTEILFADGFES